MKRWYLAFVVVLAAQAHAQVEQIHTEPLSGIADSEVRSVRLEEQSGPVVVRWGQAETLPNAADYRVRMVDLDANGDGFLTLDEVPEAHALHSEFRLVDGNRDGRISAEELANWR